VADYKLDRPVLLGEFPTRGSARDLAAIRAAAAQAGYTAAWPWSFLAEDPQTDRLACLGAVAAEAAAQARRA
jgi:hypothetical protein